MILNAWSAGVFFRMRLRRTTGRSLEAQAIKSTGAAASNADNPSKTVGPTVCQMEKGYAIVLLVPA